MTATTTTRITHINSSSTDYTTNSGVRISSPVYIDLNNLQRKELLNACREVANATVDAPVHSQSGITVTHTTGGLNKLETYLGCSFDILRTALFQRGGIPAELVLKIQLATGLELVSLKEIEVALKAKAGVVKEYIAQHQYNDA